MKVRYASLGLLLSAMVISCGGGGGGSSSGPQISGVLNSASPKLGDGSSYQIYSFTGLKTAETKMTLTAGFETVIAAEAVRPDGFSETIVESNGKDPFISFLVTQGVTYNVIVTSETNSSGLFGISYNPETLQRSSQ